MCSERRRDRGDPDVSTDIDFPIELVFGMLWCRIVGRHAALGRRFADQLTGTVPPLAAGV
jgi:hypothetical protein